MMKEEKLLYVLNQNMREDTNDISENVAVVMNLYYCDTVERYIRYIECVPEEISVYVCSSNALLLEMVETKVHRKKVFYLQKENRGRDISAFLVAAKDVLQETEMFCFIHDKSPNAQHLREDVEDWIKNLWDNTLASEAYIRNVLGLFNKNEELGLLAPPEPYGNFLTHWYGDTWNENYELTKLLARQLDLDMEISYEKLPLALGTVFWARTKALKKLLVYPWTYEDFPMEPLPIDGTISHAVERILGFAAQDAGYKTATVMTEECAADMLLRAQEDMRVMFKQLRKREHIHNLYQIKNLDAWEQELKDFCNRNQRVFIYGAGVYGKSIAQFIKDRDLQLDAFVVSPGKKGATAEINGIPVFEMDEISNKEEAGYIIGVSYEYRGEIETMLKAYGIGNYINGF